tara:strand:- start:4327 stop:4560 length:234 start_codon:yes stop_codon:yes gene_type:complete
MLQSQAGTQSPREHRQMACDINNKIILEPADKTQNLHAERNSYSFSSHGLRRIVKKSAAGDSAAGMGSFDMPGPSKR